MGAPRTNRLRELRRVSKRSVWWLAGQVGVSENWWYNLEHGEDPKLSIAVRISEMFNKPIPFIWPFWGEYEEATATTQPPSTA